MQILFEIDPVYFGYGRELISKLWNQYEYPSILFFKDAAQEEKLVNWNINMYRPAISNYVRAFTLFLERWSKMYFG